MAGLPDEIWTDVLDYLEPHDIVSSQRVSSHLLKVARDSRLWRYKCFEKAPSAAQSRSEQPNALSALTGALGGLSLDASAQQPVPANDHVTAQQPRISRRAKAVAEWDCSDATEKVDWYSEYIGRHAPLSVEWADTKQQSLEVRGMALYRHGEKIVSPMDDGSVQVWDLEQSPYCRPNLKSVAASKAGLLFQDFSHHAEASTRKPLSLGYAVENIAIDSHRHRAYISAQAFVNEVDLTCMQIVSQHRYAWPVTALSQDSNDSSFNLTIGTSWSLHVHDHRLPLGSPTLPNDRTTKVDVKGENLVDPAIAFLPNYTKLDHRLPESLVNLQEQDFRSHLTDGGFRAYARVEPGPQSILHRGADEIIIAGRMPSILFYDRRFFPKPKLSIHSGARLSAMTKLPHAPAGAGRDSSDDETLVVCGEYSGRGSLEVYGLSRSDGDGDIDALNLVQSHKPEQGIVTAEANDNSHSHAVSTSLPSGYYQSQQRYCFRNRQTASSSKLLSVCVQGTRILFSDAEGQMKWVERDGRGLARRWNINAASYSLQSSTTTPSLRQQLSQSHNQNASQTGNHQSMIIGGLASPNTTSSSADVVRKMIPLSSCSYHNNNNNNNNNNSSTTATRGDDDILVWTGEKLGIVSTKPSSSSSLSHKTSGLEEDLVAAFERKMDLSGGSGSSDSDNDGGVVEDAAENERRYARLMRRALERQADERRWMSRFGGRFR